MDKFVLRECRREEIEIRDIEPCDLENECETEANPWPFISQYYTFVSLKEKNVEFKCNMCAPQRKVLSCNRKSFYNLKIHVQRKHPNLSDKFNKCIAGGAAERKRSGCTDSGSVDVGASASKKVKLQQQDIEQAMRQQSQIVTQVIVDKKNNGILCG